MSPPWLGQPLRNIYVSNGHAYVPFVVFSIQVMSYHSMCHKRNTTGVSSGAGTACPSGAHEITTILLGYCVFCHSRYLVSDCLFDIFKFVSTFLNILRKKYCCPRTIGKNLKYIRKLVYQDYKNWINVCSSVFAWSICKSPNQKSHSRNFLKKMLIVTS
jgi:hypothetical protein